MTAGYDEKAFTLQLDASGANSVELAAESAKERDLIAFLLRSLTPGGGFSSAAAGTSVGGPSRQSQADAISAGSDDRDGDEGTPPLARHHRRPFPRAARAR